MNRLVADARLALRTWRKSPGFTAIALLSIALGIGANAAIFTLVDQVLLRVLPVRNPHELVQVTFEGARYGSNWGDGSELSYPMYTELRDHNDVFSGMFARFGYSFHIGHAGRTERVAGEIVSGSFFPVLGVGAAIGRTLTPDDDKLPGGHPVAVLSYGFWVSGFGRDPGVVNSTLVINGNPYTVIGVAQQGFDGVEVGRPSRVFVPMMMKAQLTPGWNALDERLYRWVKVFGRLKSGVTPERAKVALTPYYKSLVESDLKDPDFARAAPETRQRYAANKLQIASASQGRSNLRRTLTTPLWVLMATAAGVLLIACANVANLLLARGAARQREIAVRIALGATRRRIAGQLLVESVLLALFAGAGGVAIAAVGAPIVLGFFVGADGPQPISTSPDWRILAFTIAISTLTGVLFGMAPAVQSTRPDVAPTLKDQAGSVLGGHARLRKALVASQVAICLLLIIGAALFTRTLGNLLAVDIGFDVSHVISFGMDPTLNGYDAPRTRQFTKALLDRLNATAGVESAGIASMRILEGNQWTTSITVEGYQAKSNENSSQWANSISPGYFRTMGIPLIAGRDFTDRDERTAPPAKGERDFHVAIVNERFARHYFGNFNPIGRRIGMGGNPNTPTPIEIVGLVRDSKYTDVRDEIQRQVFFPYLESSRPSGFTVYLRTRQPADRMFEVVRRTLREIDPNLPVFSTRTLDRQVALSLSRERLVSAMTATFGTLATLLAIVGLYGVMSYTVSRRTREIGVRVAFGASAGNIRWLVIREVLVITAAGIGVGLPAAWWLGRYVSAQLYGVEPTDAVTFIGATLLLMIVAVLAGLVPSTRAAKLDPTSALRAE
jgi:putative ABC transport system permease protein